MKGPLPLAVLALAACTPGPVASDADNAEVEARKATEVMVADAKPVTLESRTPLLNWEVSWPAEVSAYPALVALIRGPAEKDKIEYSETAAKDKAERDESGFPFMGPYEYTVGVEVAGQTKRLLSLTRNWFEQTGGAHPNHGTTAILWDREGWRELKVGELFEQGDPAFWALVSESFCKSLDSERRAKRSGEAIGDSDDPFERCPKFDELAIVPMGDKNAAFTKILFHADPYVAGPYVEGDYDIELPVTAALIAALKPEYRSSFAVGQPQ